MKDKYFAIKKGTKTGIFYSTWDIVQSYVLGYHHAIYRAFKTKDKAEKFLNGGYEQYKESVRKNNQYIQNLVDNIKENETIAFTDGTYKVVSGTLKTGYGAIILTREKDSLLEVHLSSSTIAPEAKYRNVAGELEASMRAIAWAVTHGKPKIRIFHDYQGVSSWATGDWKLNTDFTRNYRLFVTKQPIEIIFTKVPAHVGISYNEKVAKLAKQSVHYDNELIREYRHKACK